MVDINTSSQLESKEALAARTQILRIIKDPESLTQERSRKLSAEIIWKGLPFLENSDSLKEKLLKTIIGSELLALENESQKIDSEEVARAEVLYN